MTSRKPRVVLKAYLMVRWAHEGTFWNSERAVVFAKDQNEARWIASHCMDRHWPTTMGDWDAREISTPEARRTARVLVRAGAGEYWGEERPAS